MTEKPIEGFFTSPSTTEENLQKKTSEVARIDRRVFLKRTGAATLGATIGTKLLTSNALAHRFYSWTDSNLCEHSNHSLANIHDLSEEFQTTIDNLLENYGTNSTTDPNPLATWFMDGIEDAVTGYNLLFGKSPDGNGKYELSLSDFGEHALKYTLKKYRDEVIHPWALSTFPNTMDFYERANATAEYWLPSLMMVAAPLYTRESGSPAHISVDLGDLTDSWLSGSYDCGDGAVGLLTWNFEGEIELQWDPGEDFPHIESWSLWLKFKVEW